MARTSSPNLHNVLYNDATPTTVEVVALRNARDALAKREAELVAELEEVRDQLQRHTAALAPIRRIPYEILGEIFGFATSDDEESNIHTARRTVVKISLVCKSWRDAAHASGRLWSYLEVLLSSINSQRIEDITRWFDRAKGSPKSLVVHSNARYHRDPTCGCSFEQRDANCEYSNEAFAKFLATGPALHHLELHFGSASCVETIMRLVHSMKDPTTATSSWSMIKSLKLDFSHIKLRDSRWTAEQNDPSRSIFRHLPPVESLDVRLPSADHLHDNTHNLGMHIPPPILANLKVLRIKCPWRGPQVIRMLQHCANVETLFLDFGNIFWSWSVPIADCDVPILSQGGKITLSTVRSLYINFYEPSSAHRFFGLLRFPSLKHLHASYIPQDCFTWTPWPNPTRTLWGVLNALGVVSADPSTPSTPLRSLCVAGWSTGRYGSAQKINAEDLNAILLSLPTLTYLALDGGFDALALKRLQPKLKAGENKPTLLPALEHLEITYMEDGFNLEALFAFIKNRRRHRKRGGVVTVEPESTDTLKRVTLYPSPFLKRATLAETYAKSVALQDLREYFGVKVDRVVGPTGRPWALEGREWP